MVDRLSNNDINLAINDLISCLGIEEDMPSGVLIGLLRKKKTEDCVQEIAIRLSLPFASAYRISLKTLGQTILTDFALVHWQGLIGLAAVLKASLLKSVSHNIFLCMDYPFFRITRYKSESVRTAMRIQIPLWQ